jgi:hypothetical protein
MLLVIRNVKKHPASDLGMQLPQIQREYILYSFNVLLILFLLTFPAYTMIAKFFPARM